MGSVKKDTLDKLNNAFDQVAVMQKTAFELKDTSDKFNAFLEKLSMDIAEASKNFEEEKKELQE